MVDDEHDRPGLPVCGVASHGLWFWRDASWERVPALQRCARCLGVMEIAECVGHDVPIPNDALQADSTAERL